MTEEQAPAHNQPPLRPRRAMLLCWLIFSALYWAGACHKPYSAHDFYSWVYAERCSVTGILTFEDTGIGHPPLYHLVQKGVQAALPFHPVNVRLANYLFGSLYVLIFAALLGRRPGLTLFCCGIAASATTLDAFMLCRMWGLVSLLALLLLVTGERLRDKFSARGAVLLLVLFLLGLFSDFGFILLLPYAAMVLLFRGRFGHHLVHLSLAGLGLVMLLLRLRHAWKHDSLGQWLPLLFYDIFGASEVAAQMLFNFWFEETFLTALAIFVICLALGTRRDATALQPAGSSLPRRAALVMLLAVPLCGILTRTGLIRVRYAWIPLILFLLLAAWNRRRYPFLDQLKQGDRCLIGMAGGLMILIAVNAHFPVSLLQARFFLCLIPLLLILLVERLNRTALNGLAVLMIVSGLVYTASNGLFSYYPAPAVSGSTPVAFADVYSYSDQYFRRDAGTGHEPWILDPRHFDSSCRVCRMGTDQVPWPTIQQLRVVGPANEDPRALVPENFELLGEENHLSLLDRLQFRLLTPIHDQQYVVSSFQRVDQPGREP